jgi:hypothetical protein
MKVKKRIGLNGYLAADITTVICAVLFILFVTKRISPKYLFISAAITGIILTLQAIWGKSTVKNKSDIMVLAKDEQSDNISIVNPGEKDSDIDGITILRDNVTVNVDQNNIGQSNYSQNVTIELLNELYSIGSGFINPNGNSNIQERISVYKIPDGVHATVTADNKVKVYSLWGGLVYKVRGGQISTPPDSSWNKMFGIRA